MRYITLVWHLFIITVALYMYDQPKHFIGQQSKHVEPLRGSLNGFGIKKVGRVLTYTGELLINLRMERNDLLPRSL